MGVLMEKLAPNVENKSTKQAAERLLSVLYYYKFNYFIITDELTWAAFLILQLVEQEIILTTPYSGEWFNPVYYT